MPSADVITADWLVRHRVALSDFTKQIESALADSDWERLPTVLDSRQKYLEHLLSSPIPQQCLSAVRKLAETIVEQDEKFLARVQDQKNLSLRQQLTLERGRQAVRAYSDNL